MNDMTSFKNEKGEETARLVGYDEEGFAVYELNFDI